MTSVKPALPSEIGILADVKERVRILEAVIPGDGGGTTVCTGCFEIDPEFADCVDLTPGACVSFAQDVFPDGTPATRVVVGADIPIGPYLCNYQAGFRVQMRYVGDYGGAQQRLWFGAGRDPSVAAGTQFQEVDGYFGIDFAPVPIDTGWITYEYDPTGVGASSDPWTLYLGGSNGSVLFDGYVGAGTMCMRYVQSDQIDPVPGPTAEGQILISLGSPPAWVRLDAGTVGQVLTIGAGGIPEWA